MKYAHQCPKCGSEDIVVVQPDTLRGDRLRVNRFWINGVEEERYVCCACGYVEHWVDHHAFVGGGGREFWQKNEELLEQARRDAERRKASYDPDKENQGTW